MSRIGKAPVAVPSGVDVSIADDEITWPEGFFLRGPTALPVAV